MPIQFNNSEPLTLGVEVELQLINPETRDLAPAALQILRNYKGSELKAELFQSMLEVNTPICQNVFEVGHHLRTSLQEVLFRAEQAGVKVCTSGTHPFADYRDGLLYPEKRYVDLFHRKQWIARRLQIFGLHVHIGMRNGDHAIQMNNALLHYLPLLLSLSASSPFCEGEDTMLASSRTTFFESSPVAGHPCLVNSWDEFVDLFSKMKKAGAVGSMKDIWWDIRPSPEFGTLEIRVCDSPPTLSEICSLVALVHALCAFIDRQIVEGRRFAPPPPWILRENKWRAARFGRDAEFILTEEGVTQPFGHVLSHLLKDLEPVSTPYNYEYFLRPFQNLDLKDASYVRQKRIFEKSHGDLTAVVDSLVREFRADLSKISFDSVKQAL